MTEEASGQGEGIQTPAPTGNELAALRAELAEQRGQNERLRGTQSTNDRELARLRTHEADLAQNVRDLEAARTALLTEVESQRTEAQTLSSRLGELEGLGATAKSALAQAEKLRIAAIMAGTAPAISLLVETNALPQIDDADAFKDALSRIATGLGQVAEVSAREILSGAKPAPGAGGNQPPTKEALFAEYDRLMRENKSKEALAVFTQALELKE